MPAWRDGATLAPMATIIIPFFVLVSGALLYAFAANPKLAEIGRLMVLVGLLWTVYLLTGRSVRLL